MGCCLCLPKNNTCRYAFIITEELQSIKNKLDEKFNCLTRAVFTEINWFKSDILIPEAPIVNKSLDHSEKLLIDLLDQASFLNEEKNKKPNG